MANNGNGSSAGTVLIAFALGAIAGAAVALLYAPATGEETRRKLADKAREGKEKVADAAGQVRRAFDDARKEVMQ